MDINTAISEFTRRMDIVYSESTPAPSFFTSIVSDTRKTTDLSVGLEIERDLELMSVDIQRGAEGTVNQWGISSQKLYTPPYISELTNFTQIDGYDRLFGQNETISVADLDNLSVAAAKRISKMARRKILLSTIDICSTGKTGANFLIRPSSSDLCCRTPFTSSSLKSRAS